ncbi:mitochondrial carrier [Gyrodon lividus]|nr:mitochondrial carrier [Gyrodon lividus]
MPIPYTSTSNDLIAGSFGGAAQVLVGQPLDTIKTRAQTAPKGLFKGPMDILVRTLRKEGFFALYKGMASPLLGIAGVNSLLFASYAASKRVISPFPELSIQQIALAGGMAGFANAVLASPVEMFKVRMQGQYGAATDQRLRDVAREMWREWGLKQGVMRGYWVTVAREIPAYAGFYAAFEFSKRQFQARYGKQVPVWALLASGSMGGIAYWLSCYPLDVIKSRIQLRSTPPASRPWSYINAELRTVVAEGGFAGLFRGLTPSLLRSIPAAGSTFAAYELTRGKGRDSSYRFGVIICRHDFFSFAPVEFLRESTGV